jgi:predicted secreted acid phosphatase
MERLDAFSSAEEAVLQTLKLLALIAQVPDANAFLESCNVQVVVKDAREALHHPVVVFDIDDTLLINDEEDDSKVYPLRTTLQLFHRLKQLGCRIYLVTARDASYAQETWRELNTVGVQKSDIEGRILFASNRDSFASISQSKAQLREGIALREKAPIALTVGDQWSDMLVLKNVREVKKLDTAYGVQTSPLNLVVLNDGITLLGLKLPAS